MSSIFNLRGFCTLKYLNFYLFNIKIFLFFKFEICAYTQLKSKNLKKIKRSSRGVRDTTERTKTQKLSKI